MIFTVCDALFDKEPDLAFALAYMKWLDNSEPSAETDLFLERSLLEASLRQKTAAAKDHPLSLYDSLLHDFSIAPSYPAKAILDTVAAGKKPEKRTAVEDMMTAITVKYNVPVIAFDIQSGKKEVTLTLAAGGEPFTAVDGTEEALPAGEPIFTWKGKAVMRRFFAEPGRTGAVTDESENVLFLIPGAASQNERLILSARNELARRIKSAFDCNGETAYVTSRERSIHSKI